MNTKDAVTNWSDIALFLAIARCGNLSAAAEEVGMSQPTLGRRLQALEQRLDVPLFVRGGRKLQLTDAGNAIMESAQRMSRIMPLQPTVFGRRSDGSKVAASVPAEGTGVVPGHRQRDVDIVMADK